MNKNEVPCPEASQSDQPIVLICGAPGSGKSWVIDQLQTKFDHVYHDSTPLEEFIPRVATRAKNADKPVVADIPFRTSIVVDALKDAGYNVHACYIVEDERTVRQRHKKRGTEFKPYHAHRVRAMQERSKTHADFSGTSEQVLQHLKEIKL